MASLEPKIDVGPILERVERNGGLAAVLERAGIPTNVGRKKDKVANRWWVRMYEARQRGYLGYYVADEFCCEVLGVHPTAVYGPDWYTVPDDKDYQRALREGRKEATAA